MIRLAAASLLALAAPLAARESLGVFDGWAAFRDDSPRRCYAIAKAQGSPAAPAYATVSNWPDRKVRGAVYLVLSLITSALMNWYNARMRLAER